jgi:RHS repeat-associated protein
MTFGDVTGSTAFVIDHDSGEVVERATYQAYGGAESDYRPARWGYAREDIRYTGHWDDAEVGLIYFGARYYSPQLARWLSPDPLTIHELESESNPYDFVSGSPIRNVDRIGLTGDPWYIEGVGEIGGGCDGGCIGKEGAFTAVGAAVGSYFGPWGGVIGGIVGFAVGWVVAGAPGLQQLIGNPANPATGGALHPPVFGPGPSPHAAPPAAPSLKFVTPTPPSSLYNSVVNAFHSSWLDSALTGNNWFANNIVPSDATLKVAQDTAMAVSTAAATVATQGMATELGAAAWGAIRAVGAGVKIAEAGVEIAGTGVEIAEAGTEVAEGAGEACAGGACTGGVCFVAGTPVETCDRGDQPIEELEPGEEVLSRDPDTGVVQCRPVVRTMKRHASDLARITVADSHGAQEAIVATLEHLFWVEGRGWMHLGDIAANDVLLAASGERLQISTLQAIGKGTTDVFNIEVKSTHTYFVGKSHVLVHNAGCPFTPDQQALVDLAKQAKQLGITPSDADTLLQWADEVNLPAQNHIGTTHWIGGDHIRIGPINHIPVGVP